MMMMKYLTTAEFSDQIFNDMLAKVKSTFPTLSSVLGSNLNVTDVLTLKNILRESITKEFHKILIKRQLLRLPEGVFNAEGSKDQKSGDYREKSIWSKENSDDDDDEGNDAEEEGDDDENNDDKKRPPVKVPKPCKRVCKPACPPRRNKVRCFAIVCKCI